MQKQSKTVHVVGYKDGILIDRFTLEVDINKKDPLSAAYDYCVEKYGINMPYDKIQTAYYRQGKLS